MRRMSLFIPIISLLMITACGGGGAAAPTKAIITISASGPLANGTLIGGIDSALNLPAGVSVKATADAANPAALVTDAGVLAASGVAAGTNTTVLGTYTPAPPAVTIKVINPAGFGTGEFVTVNCDIAAGSMVKAFDFSATALTAVDLNGAAITGLNAGLTVELL